MNVLKARAAVEVIQISCVLTQEGATSVQGSHVHQALQGHSLVPEETG